MLLRLALLWLGWTLILAVCGWLLTALGYFAPVHGAIFGPTSRATGVAFITLLVVALYLPPLLVTAWWLRR
jgi:Na+/melibiose symporter-like transporter